MERIFQSRARKGGMEGLLLRIVVFSAIFSISFLNVDADSVTPSEARQLRDEVRDMFYHAFDGYMQHAFPLDELRPLSCGGEDSLGGYALTLVDSLDTLVLLGDREQFSAAIEWLGKNLRFDIDKTVSVFETTIRILGGLLSAHLFASDDTTGMKIPSYNDELLHLSEDLATRLLPAFETPTGIPYGSVNLLHGVDKYESKITSTAGGGTLTLEFGILSRLTGNPVFEKVTKNAVRGIWARRSELNLVGAHINIFTGEWTQKDAGIGTSIDSFYEYLLKVLAGDIEPAVRTHKAFFSVWKKYGFTPEGFNLATFNVQHGQRSYPLRPELMESTYWLFKATRDPIYLDTGRDMVASLQYGAKCPCGYCHITDVESHEQEDHMESFFLAETVKYLWLLFDLAVGAENIVESGPYQYVFTTEGHLLPLSPEISLVQEHCTYFGAYCRGKDGDRSFGGHLDVNDTIYDTHRSSSKYPPYPGLEEPVVSGLMKGFCPGLTHNRKYGLSYVADSEPSVRKAREQQSTYQSKVDFIKSHSVVVISDIDVEGLISADDKDNTKISLTVVDSSSVDSHENIEKNEYVDNELNGGLSNQSQSQGSTSHHAS